MIMEWGHMNVREWRSQLELNPSGGLSEEWMAVCLLIFRELTSIVQYIHEQGVVHFDLKCENVLLRGVPSFQSLITAYRTHTLSGLICITDFGESINVYANTPNTTLDRCRGTLPIQSPEMLCISQHTNTTNTTSTTSILSQLLSESPSYTSDIWSLGLMLHELLVYEYIYNNVTWTEMYCNLCVTAHPISNCRDSLPTFIPSVHWNSLLTSSDLTAEVRLLLSTHLTCVLRQLPKDRWTLNEQLDHLSCICDTLPYVQKYNIVGTVSPMDGIRASLEPPCANPSWVLRAEVVTEVLPGVWYGSYTCNTVNTKSTMSSFIYELLTNTSCNNSTTVTTNNTNNLLLNVLNKCSKSIAHTAPPELGTAITVKLPAES